MRTHVAGHLLALEHARRGRGRADRAGLADVVRAVAHRAAGEIVPLDRALEALPDRRSRDLDAVAELALRELAIDDRPEGELHGLVAVGRLRAHGDDRARARLDHRHGVDVPRLLVEDLGHAELSAHDAFHQSLISMSTPAGRSSRISESTVFGVGEWMSMSRLCVRTSKCSRESLSLNGLRITQYTFFSVGRGTGPVIVAPLRCAVSTICWAERSNC